jgi:hypothetical protein
MATTYTLINSSELTSGSSAEFDFTAIPATYQDLVILLSARNTSNNYGGYFMKCNGEAVNTNVDAIRAACSGTSLFGNTSREVVWNMNGSTGSYFAGARIYIANYASATANKQAFFQAAQQGSSGGLIQHFSSWNRGLTSAINRIQLGTFDGGFPDVFAQHSSAYLYGISKS